jgi:hypothetical protein
MPTKTKDFGAGIESTQWWHQMAAGARGVETFARRLANVEDRRIRPRWPSSRGGVQSVRQFYDSHRGSLFLRRSAGAKLQRAAKERAQFAIPFGPSGDALRALEPALRHGKARKVAVSTTRVTITLRTIASSIIGAV